MPAYYARPGRPRSAGRLARSPQLAAELAARLTARDRSMAIARVPAKSATA